MSDAELTVALRGVVKRFGDQYAVENLDLDVAKGSFFSILGPSGCGKTTTLRMIAGFEQPDEGHILLEGQPVEGVPPYRRNVNTVFQSYALFEHLSIEDNIAFGLRRKKVPKPEITRRVGEMLGLVRLADRAKAKPRQLSGGQRQRVALARALVNLPAVLLLDEPLGALDLQLRKQMQLELKHIQREVGITFVYVTHDQEEALTMSDRIAVMNGGELQQVGNAEDVYERPANAFVAQFIGISNLLRRRPNATACGSRRAPSYPPAFRRTWPRAVRCASRSGPRSSRSAPSQTAGSPSRARSSSRSTWAPSRTTWWRSRPARA